jgi:ribonucleotide reductase alpha subunit
MPTASSATIVGVTECFEIQTSNLYTRKVLSGGFTIINKYLVNELIDEGLWTDKLMMDILGNDGSVQHIEAIPHDIKERYKTVWEYSMRSVIDMSADRSPFVCQSQSMNVFMKEPTTKKLTSMHLYSWKKGLKTLSYYVRSRASTEAIKFTVDNVKTANVVVEEEEEECLACQA